MIDSQASDREGAFQALFGPRSLLRQPLSAHTVLIVPSNDDWNDFGHRKHVDYRIQADTKEKTFETHGFIGFLEGEINGTSRLNDIVKDLQNIAVPATIQHRFFTMLPDMESYRSIVREFGPDIAVQALVAVNDLVAVSEFRTANNWIDLAIKTQIFNLSFIRNSETYFAFKNAASILRGLAFEELGRLSESLRIQFQLPGFKNSHDLQFRFDHNGELPKRIAVVIGKNGVGKSQTLSRIARAAIRGDKSLSDESEGAVGRPPLINRLLAFAPTNEAESVFPAENLKSQHITYRRFSLNRSRRAKRNEYVADLIIQLARSNQSIGESSRWDIFIHAVKALSSHDQIALVSNNVVGPFVTLAELKRGGEQRLLERYASIDGRKEPVRVVDSVGYQLSSGEISFIKFAAQVSLHIENGSLLLLDEPETHLHPNFISQFAALLDNLLRLSGSAAIIATHSSYFVREVFREQVSVLRLDAEMQVSVEHPMLRTFGADVGAISLFVFGEDKPSLLASDLEHRILAENAGWEFLYAKYKDEISPEFLGDLRAKIEGNG